MSILSIDKITVIFFLADEFCKELQARAQKYHIEQSDGKKRRNHSSRLSDSEMITILVCFHLGQFRNFKHFYLNYVSTTLSNEFPDLISYRRFIQLQHRIVLPILLLIKLCCFDKCTGITFVDSTKIAVCHNKRISRNKVFKDGAAIGKSTMGWFYLPLFQGCLPKLGNVAHRGI
ncbi:MAG: transposase [Marinifilaceae bacterium]